MTPKPQNNQTTEERLKPIRATLRYFTPRQTFGRDHGMVKGWYYTEATDAGRVSV